MEPKYDIDVELIGKDGNAFAVLGIVVGAMRRGGVAKEEIEEYRKQAMAGDYDHLLRVTMEYVNVV